MFTNLTNDISKAGYADEQINETFLYLIQNKKEANELKETSFGVFETRAYLKTPTQPVCNISDLPYILHVADIARITSQSLQTCYGYIQIEGFPYVKPEGKSEYLIPRDRFFEWLDNQAMKLKE